MYFNPGLQPAPKIPPDGSYILITAEEVKHALKKLSYNKAIGLDQLKDQVLRQSIKGSPEVAEKLAFHFSKWINNENKMPSYLKVARTIFLSKTNLVYPEYGDVRVIAILPALTKLYEVFLQRELLKNIEHHSLLHPNQRGFVAGGSCMRNIADLITLTDKAKEKVQQ